MTVTALVSTAIPAHFRWLVPATLLAASVALGGAAFGCPPRSSAEPEWDIGKYDDCIKLNSGNQGWAKYCCLNSGGEWVDRKIGRPGYCVAPASLQTDPQGPGQPPPIADPGQPQFPRPGVASPVPTVFTPAP